MKKIFKHLVAIMMVLLCTFSVACSGGGNGDKDFPKAASDVIAVINALPDEEDITLSNEQVIISARNKYNDLTRNEQLYVDNLSKLVGLEGKIIELKNENDRAIASQVVALINSLPSVDQITVNDQTQILEARNAYNVLTSNQKLCVNNLEILVTAETKVVTLLVDLQNKSDALSVTQKINRLPSVDLIQIADKEDVEEVREAYELLSSVAKAYVENLDKLLDAEQKITLLIAQKNDQDGASNVIALITELPNLENIAILDEQDIKDARLAYNGLTDAQKACVTNLNKLVELEAKLEVLLANETDATAASVVVNQIADLPIVSQIALTDKKAVEDARASYIALNANQKIYVGNIEKLVQLEQRLIVLADNQADQTVAQVVIDEIANLPQVEALTLNNKTAVEKARENYQTLTASQKNYVTNLEKLIQLEEKIIALESASQNVEKANIVDNAIDNLPSVANIKLTDETAVVWARNQYDGLTDTQKAYVTGLAKLQEAEARIDFLKAEVNNHNYLIETVKVCGVGITTTKTCQNADCGDVVVEFDQSQEAKDHIYSLAGKCENCGQVKLGAVIYSENFDGYATSNDSTAVLNTLGWRIDERKDGAYADHTAKYSLIDENGNGRLYIDNYDGSGNGSYVVMLDQAQLGTFTQNNYTYQYDLTYSNSKSGGTYIAVVNGYNGGTYNSFHLRNAGYANNERHINGSEQVQKDSSGNVTGYKDETWKGYDWDCNKTDSNSIATKLLGKTYNSSVSAFKDISVSIRYVVDWQTGNRIYIRVNNSGYAGSGKWTLVSEGKWSADFWNKDTLGSALAMKTTAGQTGYLDNVYVWTGTEKDAPTNFDNAIITSTTKECSGHIFSGDICRYCGYNKTERADYKSYEYVDSVIASKKDGEKIVAILDKVNFLFYNNHDYAFQGACSDGRYIYGAIIPHSISENGYIAKINMATGEVVKTSSPITIDHGNDMTYNPKTNKIVLVNAYSPRAKHYSIINPDTLTVEGSYELTAGAGGWPTGMSVLNNAWGVGYCEETNQYVFGVNDQGLMYTDENFVPIRRKDPVTKLTTGNGINVTQGLDFDGKYVYTTYYSWETGYQSLMRVINSQTGEVVEEFAFEQLAIQVEPEAIFHVGTDFYMYANSYTGGHIYKLTFTTVAE